MTPPIFTPSDYENPDLICGDVKDPSLLNAIVKHLGAESLNLITIDWGTTDKVGGLPHCLIKAFIELLKPNGKIVWPGSSIFSWDNRKDDKEIVGEYLNSFNKNLEGNLRGVPLTPSFKKMKDGKFIDFFYDEQARAQIDEVCRAMWNNFKERHAISNMEYKIIRGSSFLCWSQQSPGYESSKSLKGAYTYIQLTKE